jgi:capsular polysaccharide biosynthesis protein
VLKAVHTIGTGVVSPWSSRLSSALGRGLPTGVARTPDEAVAAGGRWEQARPAERHERPLPEGVPAGHWRFAAARDVTIPEVVTMELPGGRVLGPHGAVVTSDGLLVHSASTYFGTSRPGRHPLFLHPLTPPVDRVAGRVAVLASRGDGNYYHFLTDVLPRLGVLESSPGTAPVDRFLVPYAAAFQRELLTRAGVAPEQVLDSTQHPHVQAEVLVVPGLAARDLQAPSWVVPWLRERLLAGSVPGPRARLYVTRGHEQHTRRVINEDEVLALLTSRGFTPVDPAAMTVAEQVEAFSGADAVVAPHGAALANLVFASPGTRVVELFAPDYVNTCYFELASQVPGLTYRYLVGTGAGRRRERAMAGISSDLHVDVRALEGLLPA